MQQSELLKSPEFGAHTIRSLKVCNNNTTKLLPTPVPTNHHPVFWASDKGFECQNTFEARKTARRDWDIRGILYISWQILR